MSIIACMGVDRLHEMFIVDFETGQLFWKKSGKVAGGFNGIGYRTVNYTADGKRGLFLVHRVIWAMAHGAWPKETIDHIDMNRANNSLRNLREATYAENNVNRRAIRSGLKGATFDKRTKRYVAQINVAGKNKYLGRFKTEDEAHKAYMTAAREIYGEFARS